MQVVEGTRTSVQVPVLPEDVPEGMAYAQIAGVNPVIGLWLRFGLPATEALEDAIDDTVAAVVACIESKVATLLGKEAALLDRKAARKIPETNVVRSLGDLVGHGAMNLQV